MAAESGRANSLLFESGARYSQSLCRYQAYKQICVYVLWCRGRTVYLQPCVHTRWLLISPEMFLLWGHLLFQPAFFTEDIWMCHSRKSKWTMAELVASFLVLAQRHTQEQVFFWLYDKSALTKKVKFLRLYSTNLNTFTIKIILFLRGCHIFVCKPHTLHVTTSDTMTLGLIVCSTGGNEWSGGRIARVTLWITFTGSFSILLVMYCTSGN